MAISDSLTNILPKTSKTDLSAENIAVVICLLSNASLKLPSCVQNDECVKHWHVN